MQDPGKITGGMCRHVRRGLAQVAAAQPRARARCAELENMARFIAKKREIFLVQMALDIKSAEMRCLGERARQVCTSCYHSQSDHRCATQLQ